MSSVAPDRRRVIIRALIAAIILVVGFNVLAFALDEVSGARKGPTSSSYTTSPQGLAAYADLLARNGHPIARFRGQLDQTAPPSGATVVLLDAQLSLDEARVLRTFVTGGGRLITGGPPANVRLSELVVDAPSWAPEGESRIKPLAPVTEVEGISEVATASFGSWSDARSTLPALGNNGHPVVTVESVGGGRIVLLADSSILHNNLIAAADNAAFGLRIAGQDGRPVLFVESVHGFGASTGLGAVPWRWRWALGGLVLAVLVYFLARGRRLGPPEDLRRPLAPPRRDYVDALAGILARTRDPSSVTTTLQTAIRRKLAALTGLQINSSREDVARAGTSAGLTEAEAGVLAGSVRTEQDLMVLAGVLAVLDKRKGKPI